LRNLRLEEKVAKLRNPEYRATMIREALNDPPPIDFSQIFLLPEERCVMTTVLTRVYRHTRNAWGSVRLRLLSFCRWKKQAKPSSIFLILNTQFAVVEKMLDHPKDVIGLGDFGRPWKGLSTPGLLPVCVAQRLKLLFLSLSRSAGEGVISLRFSRA